MSLGTPLALRALDPLCLPACLRHAGVDMGPFLTSLGGFSVAIGLAVQSLSSNVVASLGLLAGRPFLVGDRVQLLARGSPVVTVRAQGVQALRLWLLLPAPTLCVPQAALRAARREWLS